MVKVRKVSKEPGPVQEKLVHGMRGGVLNGLEFAR